jgi:hypothetical protein
MTKRRIERLGVREGYDRWSKTCDATRRGNPVVAPPPSVRTTRIECLDSE